MGATHRPRADGRVCAGRICLLVDFSDDPWTIPASEVNNYCNLEGYTGYSNNGSVRIPFYDVSEGLLTYTNFVPTAYYHRPHPKIHRSRCAVRRQRAPNWSCPPLTNLNSPGFNFSLYDADDDGVVDTVNCFYAGYSEALELDAAACWRD